MVLRRPPIDVTENLSRSQMLAIQSAFNGQPLPSSSTTLINSNKSSPPHKKRRMNVIPDDEEDDDEEMEEVEMNNFGGGGFMQEEETENQGGFIGGGGFIADDEDLGEGGGGFIPEDEDDNSTFEVLPPRNRIPLREVPQALSTLSFPPNAQVMALFREAASDDEDGNPSVSRDRFIQICAVLTGDDDEEEDEGMGMGGGGESEDSSDGEEEEYVEEGEETRARKGASTRRITRSNVQAETIQDQGLRSEDDLSDNGSDEENIFDKFEKKKSAVIITGGGGGSKSKSQKRKKKSIRVISPEEASDTFDLFFEGSEQDIVGGGEKSIGIEEIRNAAKLLDENLNDEDIMAMLDLGRGGAVDLEAFSKILAEAL